MHLIDLHRKGKRNHVPRRRDDAGAAEKDERRAEIDHEESDQTEHDGRISNANESTGRAAAAFDGIGNIRVEAIDLNVHVRSSSNAIPQQRTTNARRHEVIAPRRANRISEEYEKNRAHFR